MLWSSSGTLDSALGNLARMQTWAGFARAPAGLTNKLELLLRESVRGGGPDLTAQRAALLTRQTLEDKKRFLVISFVFPCIISLETLSGALYSQTHN